MLPAGLHTTATIAYIKFGRIIFAITFGKRVLYLHPILKGITSCVVKLTCQNLHPYKFNDRTSYPENFRIVAHSQVELHQKNLMRVEDQIQSHCCVAFTKQTYYIAGRYVTTLLRSLLSDRHKLENSFNKSFCTPTAL